MESPATQPAPATCPNCLYVTIAPVPRICSECGCTVLRSIPDLDDFPLSWTKRVLWLGWPLVGWTIGLILGALGPFSSFALGLVIFCGLAAPLNSFLVLVPNVRRPTSFILGEPPERAQRRHRRTMILTIGLGLAVPSLIVVTFLMRISGGLRLTRAAIPRASSRVAPPTTPPQ